MRALADVEAARGVRVNLAAIEYVPDDSSYYEMYFSHAVALAHAIVDQVTRPPERGNGLEYLRVRWKHKHPDEPVFLYSELDGARREVRKLDVYRDGVYGWADASEEVGGTRLSEVPVPASEEIARDPEFEPAMITREEFEEAWAKRREHRRQDDAT